MSSCCSLRCHHSPPSSCEKRLPKIIFRNMQPSEILLFHTKRFHNFWLIWSPTHAMIIIILDRQHMSWSYSLLIANICHDHNHYRSPTHAMIIIFLTHKIFSQFSSTGLLSCYTQFLTNKVFLFLLVLSVTWWILLCKNLCQTVINLEYVITNPSFCWGGLFLHTQEITKKTIRYYDVSFRTSHMFTFDKVF